MSRRNESVTVLNNWEYTNSTSHLRDGIWEQGVQLLVGAVPDSTPACWVEILPDAAQANGHPLAEQGVGVGKLLQAVGY